MAIEHDKKDRNDSAINRRKFGFSLGSFLLGLTGVEIGVGVTQALRQSRLKKDALAEWEKINPQSGSMERIELLKQLRIFNLEMQKKGLNGGSVITEHDISGKLGTYLTGLTDRIKEKLSRKDFTQALFDLTELSAICFLTHKSPAQLTNKDIFIKNCKDCLEGILNSNNPLSSSSKRTVLEAAYEIPALSGLNSVAFGFDSVRKNQLASCDKDYLIAELNNQTVSTEFKYQSALSLFKLSRLMGTDFKEILPYTLSKSECSVFISQALKELSEHKNFGKTQDFKEIFNFINQLSELSGTTLKEFISDSDYLGLMHEYRLYEKEVQDLLNGNEINVRTPFIIKLDLLLTRTTT